ncbi:hypothetical protein HPB47_011338 [Ixodes persulcatus]|uniref:Uncharacterized protein n=1 Tax=Ixodes persulcatus TaxID=34615 RepID=A0AC60NWN0_IXOPE|nr:hypothetical protein HPB47_011338 [Ixodes persulcatus]
MGDFNGHLHELDGWEDENGRAMLRMAEDNALEILNLRASSGYAEHVADLKRLIQQHYTKDRGGRRLRKRWWDAEVQAAIRLRQEQNKEHRMKRLYQLQHKYDFFSEPVDASTETEWTSEVRKRVRDCETQQWLQDAQTKSTLGVYLAKKITIASEVRLYDNSLGSRFLFEARAGALRTLSYRRRFDTTVTSTACRVCGANNETVEHIVLDCAKLKPSRSQDNGPRLPRPLALTKALGFTDSEIGQSIAVCPATGLKVASNDTKRIVADTKRRLEDWWQKNHLREH